MSGNNFANTSRFSTLSSLANKWLNRLAPLLLLLAIIWLCWSMARILWLVLAPPQTPTLPPVPRQMSSSSQSVQQANFNIFARPTAKPSKPLTPSTPTNIALKGVMTADTLSQSSALLEVNGKIKNYRVDTQLDNSNYTLVSVDWNAVTLEDDRGQTTNITMTEPMELNQGFATNNGSSQGNKASSNRVNNSGNNINRSNRNRTNNNTNTNTNTNISASRSPTSSNNRVNNASTSSLDDSLANNSNQSSPKNTASKAINTAVKELKTNPAGYLSRMGVMATGKGYQVTGAMPANIRSKVGLEIGDKVLTVNGQNVGSDPMGDADLLKQVEKSGQAQIQIQRGDQIITIRQQF